MTSSKLYRRFVKIGAVAAGAGLITGTGLITAQSAQAASGVEPAPAAVAAAMSGEPTAAEVSAATPKDRLALATRCVDIETLTYCLGLGWVKSRTDADSLRQTALSAGQASEAGTGDVGLLSLTDAWAKSSATDRTGADKAEITAATASVGKMQLRAYLLSGKPVPQSFWTAHPETVSYGKPLAAATTAPAAAMSAAAAASFNRTPSSKSVGDTAKALKQTIGYYCGPTSMAVMGWNNPGSALSHDPAYWAGKLGTTTDGTSVTSMASVANRYTNWDDKVGPYTVTSISSWDAADWRDQFWLSVGLEFGLIILHPKLSPAVSSYYPGTTSGHFDVGRGYNFSSGHDSISIYEPAGSSLGVPKVVSDSTANVRLANLNNASFKNIAV